MLKWSEIQVPTPNIPYHHVVAESPLGDLVIEWKAHKENDSPICVMPHDHFLCCGYDLDDTKNQVQERIDMLFDDLHDYTSHQPTEDEE